MKIKIKEETVKVFLQKASLVLTGVLSSSMILAFMIGLLKEWGALIGIIINLGLAAWGLYRWKQINPIRLISYGIIANLAVITTVYLLATKLILSVGEKTGLQ